MGPPVVLNDRRVLITGASGFIGNALAARGVSEGFRVRGAVRNMTRAAELPAGVEAAFVPDAGPDADWAKALAGVNAVVHLAGCVHQEGSPADDAPWSIWRGASTRRVPGRTTNTCGSTRPGP
jgi:nucleoside-diphosphate-sugar epimerase